MMLAFLSPGHARTLLLVLLAIGYAGYHAWDWWRRRPRRNEDAGKGEGAPMPAVAPDEPCRDAQHAGGEIPQQGECRVEDAASASIQRVEAVAGGSPLPKPDLPPPPSPPGESPGEEDFRRARAMPHRVVPDFSTDGLYLDLLGESAEKGYAPAMAKLGEYAVRRGTWVEAYYWTWRARRGGVPELDAELRRIRHGWAMAGCPGEKENVNDLFDEERGSVGRALLDIAAGRGVAAARGFLKENHPEFL